MNQRPPPSLECSHKSCKFIRSSYSFHPFTFISLGYAIVDHGRGLMPFIAISGHVEMGVKGATTLSSISVETKIREVMVCDQKRATHRFPQSNEPGQRLFW